jgi:hypothetical protein
MPDVMERDLFIKSARSRETLLKSLETFRAYLKESVERESPLYYQARNFLKDGKTFYEEAVKEARKLLGPIPNYVPDVVKASKARLLAENKFVIESRELQDIESEIAADDFFSGWVSRHEIRENLSRYLNSQNQERRKTANVKIRMMLDILDDMLQQARKLEGEARLKHQGA